MNTCSESKADIPSIEFLPEPLEKFLQSLDDLLDPDEPGMKKGALFTDVHYEAFCIAGDRLATNFCLCVDQVDCALFSKGNDGSGTWRQYVEAQGERLLFGPNRTRGSAEDITGALDALYEGATAEADYLSNAQFDR